MYRAVISFLFLMLLVGTTIALNPQATREARDLWEEFKPTVLGWRDKFAEVVRAFLGVRSGESSPPNPIQPDIQMELIITLKTSHSGL